MQFLITTLNNSSFIWLILLSFILVIYLYQLYQTKQVRARLSAAEARCSEHEFTIETLRFEEITSLEEQLQKLQVERDQAVDQYLTLQKEQVSQLYVIEQNYDQLQTSYLALLDEHEQIQHGCKMLKQKHDSQLQSYEVVLERHDTLIDEYNRLKETYEPREKNVTLSDRIQQYFEQYPNSTITAAANALGSSRNTVKKYRERMLAQIEQSSPTLAMAAD